MTDSRKVLSLEVGKLTDLGKIRHHLVDSLGFYKPDEPDVLYSKGELFLVADGIGGHERGAQAARMATDLIIKNYYKSTETDPETSLKHAFNIANMRIIEANQESAGQILAGTSLTCVVIQRGTLHVAHIGNCRLYLIKSNKIKQLTHDHVSREKTNLLPDMRKSGLKFEVSRALGWNPGVDIQYFSHSLKPNDCLLLCTDGLFQVLDNQEIGRLALKYSPQDACERFITTANEKGGPDNITTILVKINGLVTISESFAQNLGAGINLMNPATRQQPEPETHRPGVTFRIGNLPPEIETEAPCEVELIPPTPSIEAPDESAPEPVVPHQPEEFQVPVPDKTAAAPPRIPTPRPFRVEKNEEEPVKAAHPPKNRSTLGIRRRRNIALPKRQFDYPKIFKGSFLAMMLIGLLYAVGYLLIHDGSQSSDQPVSETESLASTLAANDSALSQSPVLVEQPPSNLEVQAGTGKTTTEFSAPLKVILLNSNRLSSSAMQRLINAFKSPEIGQTEFTSVTLIPSVGSRTKIIYRFPENGTAETVHNTAKHMQQTIKEKYKKEIDITHCDITLILGKDIRMSEIKTRELRRRVLKIEQSDSVHLEILNGSGTSGLGGRIKGVLNDLIINEKHYLKIIDVRNASRFDYSNTVLKCRTSQIALASKLADILGLPTISRSIVIDDLEDIQLVLGRDFNY